MVEKETLIDKNQDALTTAVNRLGQDSYDYKPRAIL